MEKSELRDRLAVIKQSTTYMYATSTKKLLFLYIKKKGSGYTLSQALSRPQHYTHCKLTVHVLLARESARFASLLFSSIDDSAVGAADRLRVFRSANCKTDFVFRRISGLIRAEKMGNAWTHYVSEPQNRPDFENAPTFDPLQGFPSGRKERGETQNSEVLFFRTDFTLGLHYFLGFWPFF